MWEFSFDVREDFPSILTTRITNQPTDTQPKVDIDQFVTSTISYDGEISNAYIQWSADISSVVNTIPMTNTSGIYGLVILQYQIKRKEQKFILKYLQKVKTMIFLRHIDLCTRLKLIFFVHHQ